MSVLQSIWKQYYNYSGIEMYRHCGNAELERVIIIINNDNIQ